VQSELTLPSTAPHTATAPAIWVGMASPCSQNSDVPAPPVHRSLLLLKVTGSSKGPDATSPLYPLVPGDRPGL
jgi:hypothetical protein